jgi:hypothetical protein
MITVFLGVGIKITSSIMKKMASLITSRALNNCHSKSIFRLTIDGLYKSVFSV